jgi:serine phosphatase RsbU (regulator of sigma subunit)
VLLLAIFLVYNHTIKNFYDPNSELERIQSDGRILKLGEWRAMFESCTVKDDQASDSTACRPVGEYYYDLAIPDVDKLTTLVSKLDQPTHVTLYYSLSEKELEWLKQRSQIILFSARTVHHESTLTVMEKSYTLEGMGLNLFFQIQAQDLLRQESLRLRIHFQDLPWFGPADLPIVLGEISGISDMSLLTVKQGFAGNISRALEFSSRLLVALMAIVLDHSRAFTLLGLYALGRGLRDLGAFLAEFDLHYLDGFINNIHFYNAANAMCLATMLIFFASLYQLKFRWKHLAILFAGAFSLLTLWLIFDHEDRLWLYSDLLTDMLGSLIASGLCLWHLTKIFRGWSNKAAISGAKPATAPPPPSGRNHWLQDSMVLFRSLLLLTALGFHFYANASSLDSSNASPFKDMLDPKNFVLFYTMVLAALIEVGSTSKAMFRFGERLAKQATMAKDLEIGRQVQQEMLPQRKLSHPNWNWRSLYYPATELAGDWFDLRMVRGTCGKEVLIGAVSDITGHGVGAAMITSTISSHWGVWCQILCESALPQTGEDWEKSLTLGITSVNRGLGCLRTSQGATGAFFVLDPDLDLLIAGTPGHPGIVIEKNHQMKYLTAQGPRLGSQDFRVATFQQHVELGDEIHVLTDGLCPPKEAIGKFLAHCKREMRDTSHSLASIFFRQARQNRRAFRLDPSLEDDMTLLMIKYKPNT